MDFGIDLGISKCYIAKIDGKDTIVIPNATDNKDYISSAVYINKNGRVYVGDKAKSKIAIDPKNGYEDIILLLGSDDVYNFESSTIKMSPAQLTAEILKNLRKTANASYQKDIRAVVIAVPDNFNALQTKATSEAAKIAGFSDVLLVQKHTAVTMAYGFLDSSDEIWMIYDFNESEFDVSLMKKYGDDIVNINSISDDYLGGKLIDLAIVDEIFVPEIIDELGLNDFNRSNPKYVKQFAKLKKAAENAKEELSFCDVFEIEIENFLITDDGELFDFEYDMTRSQLEEVMEKFVRRTVNHCRMVLSDINLDPSGVSKIILVGESVNPYIHERLSEEFNIPVEDSIDPKTVTVRGAAVFAGTKDVADDMSKADYVNVEVCYESKGKDLEFEVSGRISNPNASLDGFLVELVDPKTSYSSGKIRVDVNGEFIASIIAEDDKNNAYEIRVYDSFGNDVGLSSDSAKLIEYVVDRNVNNQYLNQNLADELSAKPDLGYHDDLANRLEKNKARYDDIITNSKTQLIPEIQTCLNQISNGKVVENIEALLDDGKTDSHALDNAADEINNFSDTLDKIEGYLNNSKGFSDIQGEVSKPKIEINRRDIESIESEDTLNFKYDFKLKPIRDDKDFTNKGSGSDNESSEKPEVESKANDSILTRPGPAYRGYEPYVFVSYAHRDAELVFPEIKRFNDMGLNVWYDEGISYGQEWDNEVAHALENSSLFVVFMTNNAFESRAVSGEIKFALSLGIPIIPIYLEETELKGALMLSLSQIQSILKYEMSEYAYVSQITESFRMYGFNLK